MIMEYLATNVKIDFSVIKTYKNEGKRYLI